MKFGHIAPYCPEPLKPEIAAAMEAKGKGKGKGPNGSGGWQSKGSKGKGKGKPSFGKGNWQTNSGKGKGKGKIGLHAVGNQDDWTQHANWYDQQAWDQWQPDQWQADQWPQLQPQEPIPLKSLKGFNSLTRVKSINSVIKKSNGENENSFRALSEPDDVEEDDGVSIADSEDVPGHVDSDSEDEAEPEWMKNKPVMPDMNKIMQTAWKKAEETDERNKKILSGQPPRGHDEVWTKARNEMKAMRDSAENDGWQVKVKKSKAMTQSGKNVKKEKVNLKPVDTLRRIRDHGQLMAVSPEQWVEVRLTVDSGAGESVIPPTEAENVPLQKGERTGCKYEVANGEIIVNQGEKRCAMITEQTGQPRQLNLQVSDVHKGLLSVIELVKKGQRVVFDNDWSYIQDKSTGVCDTLLQTDDSFELVTWVKPVDSVVPNTAGFARQCP